jgi:5-methylcytosine-specific restriction protein A
VSKPNADDFRSFLKAHLRKAERHGARSVDITSGDLHRELGGYPARDHAMPTCCNVMRQEMRGRDVVIAGPPSGLGATLTIRYYLPR